MIHVFKRNIGKKDDKGRYLPAIAVKDSPEGDYSAYRVAIYGYCEIVYRPDRPFRSGAKVWIETFAPILPNHFLIFCRQHQQGQSQSQIRSFVALISS